jgi:hypothetical protein
MSRVRVRVRGACPRKTGASSRWVWVEDEVRTPIGHQRGHGGKPRTLPHGGLDDVGEATGCCRLRVVERLVGGQLRRLPQASRQVDRRWWPPPVGATAPPPLAGRRAPLRRTASALAPSMSPGWRPAGRVERRSAAVGAAGRTSARVARGMSLMCPVVTRQGPRLSGRPARIARCPEQVARMARFRGLTGQMNRHASNQVDRLFACPGHLAKMTCLWAPAGRPAPHGQTALALAPGMSPDWPPPVGATACGPRNATRADSFGACPRHVARLAAAG